MKEYVAIKDYTSDGDMGTNCYNSYIIDDRLFKKSLILGLR